MSGKLWVSAKDAENRTFTVAGDTFDEFFQNLSDTVGPQRAAQVVDDFQLIVDPPRAARSQPAAPSAGAPAASNSNPPPAPGAPTCAHGQRTHRTGTSSKGKWSAWFCPQPKGADQCEPMWA